MSTSRVVVVVQMPCAFKRKRKRTVAAVVVLVGLVTVGVVAAVKKVKCGGEKRRAMAPSRTSDSQPFLVPITATATRAVAGAQSILHTLEVALNAAPRFGDGHGLRSPALEPAVDYEARLWSRAERARDHKRA